MDINQIRRQNINHLAEKYGRGVLAEKIGYKDTVYLNQLCAGHGSFGGRTARNIEKALDLPHGWMDTLESTNLAVLDKKPTKVPLISWVAAGNWCESPDNFSPGDAEDWLASPFSHSKHAFCLTVKGESMMPKYRDGEIILVDPEVAYKHNSDVVVREPNGGSNFKCLQITPTGTYLLLLNPDWPADERIIKMPEGTVICGVVIGSWIDRRQ